MSLTSRIQALIAYANEVTGQSDTTLADAVATLAGGYGSGGGYSIEDLATNQEPSGAIVVNGNVATNGFYAKTRITSLYVKGQITTNSLSGLSGLLTAVIAILNSTGAYVFNNCSHLKVADIIGTSNGKITGNRVFQNCTELETLILRQTTFCEIVAGAFSSCPAASGGAGITVYVPASLKATYETNSVWSGLEVTFASIEGSIYETQYADGTPIE